jgi:glycosyltransferase involved in cell wall biosynthesis
MKILTVAEYIPTPPQMAGSPRSFCFARELSRDHEVSLVIFGDRATDAAEIDALEDSGVYTEIELLPRPNGEVPLHRRIAHSLTNQWYKYNGVLRPEYLAETSRRIDEIVRDRGIDVIYADGLGSVQFISTRHDSRVFLDMCDTPAGFYRRILGFRKSFWSRWSGMRAVKSVELWQARSIQRFPVTLVISEAEKSALGPDVRLGDVRVISNGIDSAYFCPEEVDVEQGLYVFVGVMGYGPNRDGAVFFADEVMPRVAEWEPTARFVAVGKGADDELKARYAGSRTEFTGEVDDVRPWVRRAEAFVCPLRTGAGLKNKVLVAMATRVPVVCSRLSLEGIDATPGEHLLVADTPEEYLEAFQFLRTSPEGRAEMIENAYRFVIERFTWESKRRQLNDLVESIARRSEAPSPVS